MKLVMEVLKPAILDQIETPDPKVHRDLKTLAAFIELYCVHNHANETRHVVSLRTHDVKRIAGRNIELCPQCTRLLTHAFVKRSHCPMNPKPACKHCPAHCYHPRYRAAIAEVMRFSGRRMVMGGRLDYLVHLLF
jgi:hypothetical protein